MKFHSVRQSQERAAPWSRAVKWKWAALAAVVVACMGASVGDVMFVKRITLPIRQGKFAFNPIIASAVQGESLTVIAVDGSWLKVQYKPIAVPGPTVEGYVFEDGLSARQVPVATATQTGSAADVGGAAAAKEILSATSYALSKGMTEDPFYKMVLDSHSSVTNESFTQFASEGHLGPYKPNPSLVPGGIP